MRLLKTLAIALSLSTIAVTHGQIPGLSIVSEDESLNYTSPGGHCTNPNVRPLQEGIEITNAILVLEGGFEGRAIIGNHPETTPHTSYYGSFSHTNDVVFRYTPPSMEEFGYAEKATLVIDVVEYLFYHSSATVSAAFHQGGVNMSGAYAEYEGQPNPFLTDGFWFDGKAFGGPFQTQSSYDEDYSTGYPALWQTFSGSVSIELFRVENPDYDPQLPPSETNFEFFDYYEGKYSDPFSSPFLFVLGSAEPPTLNPEPFGWWCASKSYAYGVLVATPTTIY